jgi:hypothetical protein
MNKIEAHAALDTLLGKEITILEQITNLTVDLFTQKTATEKAEITTALTAKQACTIKLLRNTLHNLTKPGSGNSRNYDNKTLVQMSKMAPSFEETTKAYDFWQDFAEYCDTYEVKIRDKVVLLRSQVSSHPRGQVWFTHHVFYRMDSISDTELKSAFFSGFLEANWQTERLLELMDIRWITH